MRYSISSNLRIGKSMFSTGEKLNFKQIGNSVHTTGFLAMGKTVNICINYLMFYPSRQDVKWKHFKYTNLHSTIILWWTGSWILVWPEMTLAMHLSVGEWPYY